MQRSFTFIGLVAAVVLAPWFAFAADDAPKSGNIDPRAAEVIRSMSDHVAGLSSFKVDAVTAIDVTNQGQNIKFETTQEIRVERPNKLAMLPKESDGRMPSVTLVSDGVQQYSYMSQVQKYSVEEAGDSFDALSENPLLGMGGIGNMILMALLNRQPYDTIMEGVEAATYEGIVELDGAKYHHLKLVQAQMDVELWVAAGDRPLLRRFVPDMSKVIAQLGGGGRAGDMKMQMSLDMKNWQTGVALTADDFKFEPPPGAEKVDSLLEALVGGAGGRGEPEIHALVGKEAPEFKLDLAGGGTIDLAAHRDKDVVILDFWATWCGPCRQAMPIIAKVAAEYKQKGVAFYAVNIQEDQPTIDAFLEESGLDLTVAMDVAGNVAGLYQAAAIPQTVLVGKDGSVQVVHVGLLPNLEDQLRKELDALTAGKDLAAETLGDQGAAQSGGQ